MRFDPDNGGYPDAESHLPGARFWIPTFDESLNAFHYDPDHGGPGVGGYWMYPNGSDTAPIIGTVEDGGETNAGSFQSFPWSSRYAGAYPDVRTPWGLLDASGGVSEWTESISGGSRGSRRYDGTSWLLEDPEFLVLDLSYRSGGYGVYSEGRHIGLRIASAVPEPHAFALMLSLALLRRRRAQHTLDQSRKHSPRSTNQIVFPALSSRLRSSRRHVQRSSCIGRRTLMTRGRTTRRTPASRSAGPTSR